MLPVSNNHSVLLLTLQGIVGNLSSGKSALVHRYLTGTYVQEESPEGKSLQLEVWVRRCFIKRSRNQKRFRLMQRVYSYGLDVTLLITITLLICHLKYTATDE